VKRGASFRDGKGVTVRRIAGYRVLVLLAWTVGGALTGAALGCGVLLGERCAGPMCAGLIVLPMMTAIPGAAAGLIVGIALWLRARGRSLPLDS
jgi:hypothetical protein